MKGKAADMVVLNRNLFEIDPDTIFESKVVYTIFAGKIVYSALARFSDRTSRPGFTRNLPNIVLNHHSGLSNRRRVNGC
jgi:hypothetical protein